MPEEVGGRAFADFFGPSQQNFLGPLGTSPDLLERRCGSFSDLLNLPGLHLRISSDLRGGPRRGFQSEIHGGLNTYEEVWEGSGPKSEEIRRGSTVTSAGAVRGG